SLATDGDCRPASGRVPRGANSRLGRNRRSAAEGQDGSPNPQRVQTVFGPIVSTGGELPGYHDFLQQQCRTPTFSGASSGAKPRAESGSSPLIVWALARGLL